MAWTFGEIETPENKPEKEELTGEAIAQKLKLEIDKNSEEDNPPKFAKSIAPSSIGDECVARQWYKWRWVKLIQKPGRISRIFERGNRSEFEATKLLRRAGWEVRDYTARLCCSSLDGSYITLEWDAPIPEGFTDVHDQPHHIAECQRRDRFMLKQYSFSAIKRHMNGNLDGYARHPVYSLGLWYLTEYKEYNTKRFSALTRKSVKEIDYDYYVQIVLYMQAHDLPRCVFVAINKNDDDVHIEIIERDDATANAYMATANSIVYSKVRPARFAESAAHHVCKMCDYLDICHHGVKVEINCRSCLNCIPEDDGRFYCQKWQALIPNKQAILAGCPEHQPCS